jgi:trehalose/maltose hydrolase-like predicted phosphorylase
MLFHPDIAVNLLRNRLFQLPSYRLNAKSFNLSGAYIPLCVGGTGGFVSDNLINHIEIHTVGDTALFVKQAIQTLQNISLLQELYPLLEAASDFVVSRINRTDQHGTSSIETVIGADEENGVYDNDIYTNAVFVQALETTIHAAGKLGLTVDSS